MTNSVSTPAQRRLLQALIDAGAGYPSELGRLATVRVCRANGWIEQMPAEPFTVPQYSITTAGRAIVERKPRPAAERAKIAQEARSANATLARRLRMAAELHAAGWYLVMPQRADEVRMILSNSGSYEEDWGEAEFLPHQ